MHFRPAKFVKKLFSSLKKTQEAKREDRKARSSDAPTILDPFTTARKDETLTSDPSPESVVLSTGFVPSTNHSKVLWDPNVSSADENPIAWHWKEHSTEPANDGGWKQAFENQKQAHENELRDAQKSNEVLRAALAKAHTDAVSYETRMHELNHALNQTPEQTAHINTLIEAKDSMFSELEKKAGECYSAFIALDKSSREDRSRAEREIAELEEELAVSRALVTSLQDSKAAFQSQGVDLLTMLRKKVFSTDFIKAMDHHFLLMMQDNSYMVSSITDLDQKLTNKDLKIGSLQAKLTETIRSLDDRKEQCSSLESTLREKDYKIGSMDLELDALPIDHQDVVDGRDTIIAGLQRQIQEVQDSTIILLDSSRDERERQVIEGKDTEISQLKQDQKEYTAENRELQDELIKQEEIIKGNTAAVAQAQSALAEKSAELSAAKENLETMQLQIGGQLGLPPTISVLELLNEREENSHLRMNYEILEKSLERAGHDAGELQTAYNEWMPAVKELAWGMLARLRRAQGGPARLQYTETDEELEQLLETCPKKISR